MSPCLRLWLLCMAAVGLGVAIGYLAGLALLAEMESAGGHYSASGAGLMIGSHDGQHG